MNEKREVRIVDMGTVVTGATPSTKNSSYYGMGYNFIKPSDMSESSRTITTTETTITKSGISSLGNRQLPEHAVCVVCIGTIGKVAMTSVRCATNQQINSIIVDPNNFNPYYVYYLLKANIAAVKVVEGGSASGRQHVRKSVFEQIELRVHSLPTQRKIASILSAYDDLIENNNRRIQILEEMAQRIYREWFVHFRFPGHEDVKMVDSELGKIPEGWEVRKFRDFASFTKGKKPKEFVEEAGKGVFPYLTIDAINGSEGLFCESGGLVEATRKDILMVMDGASSSKVYIGLSGIVGSTLAKININPTLAPHILFHALKYRNKRLVNVNVGAAIPHANKDFIESMKFPLPAGDANYPDEGALSKLQYYTENLSLQNQSLRKTRDLLLPRLISGRLDVEELDIAV